MVSSHIPSIVLFAPSFVHLDTDGKEKCYPAAATLNARRKLQDTYSWSLETLGTLECLRPLFSFILFFSFLFLFLIGSKPVTSARSARAARPILSFQPDNSLGNTSFAWYLVTFHTRMPVVLGYIPFYTSLSGIYLGGLV